MNLNYSKLLLLISNFSDENNKNIIENNIDYLSESFSKLSGYLASYIDIVSKKGLDKNKKVDEIRNLGYDNKKFTKKQADKIYKIINFDEIKGGSTQENNLSNLKNEWL